MRLNSRDKTSMLKTLSYCHDKLFRQLFDKAEELKQRASQPDEPGNLQQIIELTAEITSLELRLWRCENLMEQL